MSDVEIVAVTPGWRRSMCVQATLRGLSGLCQTEVRVTGRGGASPTVPDLPPLAGTLSFDRVGMLNAPPRCRCEAYPSATEFDYATRLTLTSIADLAGNSLAGNPGGGDELRLTGTGLNVLTLGWVNFGPPTVSASQDYDLVAVARSGTSIFLYSAVDPLPSPTGNVVKVSVSTLAGNSDTRPFHYVPIQIVSSLSTDVLPSTGGAPFTIRGGGFRGAVQVEFEPDPTPIPPVEMLSGFKVRSATVITLSSPAMAPGSYRGLRLWAPVLRHGGAVRASGLVHRRGGRAELDGGDQRRGDEHRQHDPVGLDRGRHGLRDPRDELRAARRARGPLA